MGSFADLTARKEAELAMNQLSHLPASPYKDALVGLARFSVDRSF